MDTGIRRNAPCQQSAHANQHCYTLSDSVQCQLSQHVLNSVWLMLRLNFSRASRKYHSNRNLSVTHFPFLGIKAFCKLSLLHAVRPHSGSPVSLLKTIQRRQKAKNPYNKNRNINCDVFLKVFEKHQSFVSVKKLLFDPTEPPYMQNQIWYLN